MQKITAEILTNLHSRKWNQAHKYTTEIYPGNPSVGKTSKEGIYYGFRGIITVAKYTEILTAEFFPFLHCTAQPQLSCTAQQNSVSYSAVRPSNFALFWLLYGLENTSFPGCCTAWEIQPSLAVVRPAQFSLFLADGTPLYSPAGTASLCCWYGLH